MNTSLVRQYQGSHYLLSSGGMDHIGSRCWRNHGRNCKEVILTQIIFKRKKRWKRWLLSRMKDIGWRIWMEKSCLEWLKELLGWGGIISRNIRLLIGIRNWRKIEIVRNYWIQSWYWLLLHKWVIASKGRDHSN